MTQALLLDNPLWQFSLTVYQCERLQRQLLALQNQLGANVNVMLCQGWLRHQGQHLSITQWQKLFAQLQPWQKITEQLRNDRIQLKPAAAIAPPAAQLRNQVKRGELLSEQYQQALMYQYCRAFGNTGAHSWCNFLSIFGWDEGSEQLPGAFAEACKRIQ